MGQIINLRNEIEAIITAMTGCDYLRASFREANTKLLSKKITECLAIHTDQTEVTGNVSPGYVYKTIPIEILFVYKNSKIDEKLYDVDSLVDKAEDKADEFFDKLIQSSVINDTPEFEDYSLQRLEAFKKYDTIVTGVLFQWTAPVNRTQYYCS